jgi:hypothetical protein
MQGMELAGVITGAIALLISGIVAWKNYLSPFNVKIYCGNPRLELLPLKLEDGRTVSRFSAILPLYFVNTGAREGVIRDIILIVNSDQDKWLFQSVFYTKYSIKTESTLGKTLTKDPSNEPFYPVHLAGKSEVYKAIVFVPLKTDSFSLGTSPLSAGNYSFTVKTLEVGKEEYKTKLVFNINLNDESIANLSKCVILLPFLEEIKDERQRLS